MSLIQSPATVPQSPKAGHLRRSLYKQSPAKTPLREVLKARWGPHSSPAVTVVYRCKERMRAGRDSVLEGRRKIPVEGKEVVEAAIRDLVREEAAAWRGGRRYGGFKYACYGVFVLSWGLVLYP